jgi:hypothetical protein
MTRLYAGLAAAIVLGLALFFLRAHWIGVGEGNIQAKWGQAKLNARTQAAAHNAAQSAAGSTLASQAAAAAAESASEVSQAGVETKKVIEYVYRDPPKGAPARLGGCAYPVDQRVQDRIQLGVDQARAASR